MLVVVGLDLSLSGLGACAIPGDWDPSRAEDWRRIARTSFESKPGAPMPARMKALAYLVAGWLDEIGARRMTLKICHEGYPLGGKTPFAIDKLIELGGVVKHVIWGQLGIELWSSPEMTARKLVCGKLPPRDRKAAAIGAIRGLSFGELDNARADECDAVIAANLYRKHLGLSYAFTPEPPKEKRPSKRRSRTQVGQLVLGRGAP
jgi:hypothetical protein